MKVVAKKVITSDAQQLTWRSMHCHPLSLLPLLLQGFHVTPKLSSICPESVVLMILGEDLACLLMSLC